MVEIRKIVVEVQRLTNKLNKISNPELIEETNQKLEIQRDNFKFQARTILRKFAKSKKWDDFDWAHEELSKLDITPIGGIKSTYETLYERPKDLSSLI